MIGPSFVYKSYGGDKFLQWLHKAFRQRSFIGLKDREVRSFVWVQDVVTLIHSIIELYLRDQETHDSALDAIVLRSGKIYNAGGPTALSRLAVAAQLCSSLGVDLQVVSASDGGGDVFPSNNTSAWKVYAMSSPLECDDTPLSTTTIIDRSGLPSFIQLHSPLNIAMDSTITKQAFALRFADLNDVLLRCL